MSSIPNRRRGRFAPSPTGPLHFGSLVTAVASYLDAKSTGAEWLVRMEDVDTPRTVKGAADAILRSLEAHGLLWDGEVLYQSRRGEAYRAAFDRLAGHVFGCACTRRDLGDSGLYPGTCRNGLPPGTTARAWRVRIPEGLVITYRDRLRGALYERLDQSCGDFIVLRADAIFAYQLAVVVDDAEQQVTDIVRGDDLLDSTARQIYLQQLLGVTDTPRYLHLPVVRDAQGEKLSKQTGAEPLDDSQAALSLHRALAYLDQCPPLEALPVSELLAWAVANWDAAKVRVSPMPEPGLAG